jgi:N6-adenosine-specific RNA methylase IME4
MSLDEIKDLPVASICEPDAFLWLWVPNTLLLAGIDVMRMWGFDYKQLLTWVKTDKRGVPTRKGIAFYFQPMTEFMLFGVRGIAPRKLMTSKTESNVILSPRVMSGGHSRKPAQMRQIIEAACPGPRIELFARGRFPGWDGWGNQADDYIEGEAPDRMRSKRLF